MFWKSPWTKGLVVGVGAIVAAPIIFPAAAAILRPVAKMLIAGALAVGDAATGLWAEASPAGEGKQTPDQGNALKTALISEASGAAAAPLAEEVAEVAAEVFETLA